MKPSNATESNTTRGAVKISYSFFISSPKYGMVKILIDEEDKDLVSKYHWSLHNQRGNLYAVTTSWCPILKKSTHFYLHRLVTKFQYPIVDHINNISTDNRKQNLRNASHSVNMRNSLNRMGRLLPRGIYKRSKRYTARFVLNGKVIPVGVFDTVEEAVSKREEKMREYKIEL